MPYLQKECVTHVYKHMVFYALCLALLVLHVKCKNNMHMNSLSHYNADLRNNSALAKYCWIIIHCLKVSCIEDQITSA